MDANQLLERYLELFVNSQGELSESLINELVADDYRFADPFNSICGRKALAALLDKTRREVKQANFTIEYRQRLVADAGPVRWLVKWHFTGQVAVVGRLDFVGLSEIEIAGDGRVASHIDYWDAAAGFYARVPLLGTLIGLAGRAAKLPD